MIKKAPFFICALSTILMPLAILSGRAGADICLSLGAIFFLIYSFQHKDFSWTQKGWVQLLFGFWVYLFLSSFFAHSTTTALKVSGPWVRYPLYAAMIATLTLHHQQVREAMQTTLLLVVMFFIVDAFYQYIMRVDLFGRPVHNSVRLTGPYHYPRLGLTTTWLVFPAMMFLYQKLHSCPPILRSILISAFSALSLVAIFLSGDRSGFLLFLLGATILPCLVFRKQLATFLIRIMLFALFTLVLTFTVYTIVHYMKHQREYMPISPNAALPHKNKVQKAIVSLPIKRQVASTTNKIQKIIKSPPMRRQIGSTVYAIKRYKDNSYVKLFLDGFRAVKKHLIFGVGANNFQFHCTQKMVSPHKCGYRHPHNVFIDLFALSGLLGTLLFLSWAFWVFWHALHTTAWKNNHILLTGLLIAFFIRLWPFVGTTSLMLSWASTVFWFISGWLIYYIEHETPKPSV